MMRSILVTMVMLCSFATLPSVAHAQVPATGPFNVRTYGATGHCDIAADTAGIVAAINAVPASGGEVYFPAGTYCVNQTIGAGKPIAFRGEGQRISNIVWYSGTFSLGGIEFWSGYPMTGLTHKTLAIRSLSLLRHDGTTGAAIFAQWEALGLPVPMGHANGGGITATIEDVHIGIDPTASPGTVWERGIWMRNSTISKITTFNIQGNGADGGGFAGITLDGWPGDPSGGYAGGRAVVVDVSNGSITGYQRGIDFGMKSEGLQAHNLTIREVLWGFALTNTGPGTAISNCDVLAKWRGITLYNSGDMAVSGNQITQFQNDTGVEFIGIEVNNEVAGERIRVIGNSITSPPGTTATRRGITFANNITNSVIQGNTTQNQQIGIWLVNAPVANNMIMGNVNRGTTSPIVNGGAPSNYVVHNP
jgi:hypothetical protein